jgi:hypothetical protein
LEIRKLSQSPRGRNGCFSRRFFDENFVDGFPFRGKNPLTENGGGEPVENEIYFFAFFMFFEFTQKGTKEGVL